jgi:DNA gyrase subunit A
MVTAKANCKRVNLKDFSSIQKTGIIACTLDAGDEVISARLTYGSSNVIVASSAGKAIVFPEDNVRVMGRQAQGVRAIRLDENETVVGMDVIYAEDDFIINLTSNGYGKKTPVSSYPVQARAGKGVLAMETTEKTGVLVGVRVVRSSDELIVISSSGQIIRVPVGQIRTTKSRSTQGVKAISLKDEETILDFTLYVEDEPSE